jgi:GAF domain-containing protein
MSDRGRPTEGVRLARGTSGQQPESGLARDLSRMAREMHSEPDRAALLRRVVDTTLSEIDGAEWAGISTIDKQHVRTEAASDELVQRIDDLQYRLEEGPCLTSLRDAETVRSEDLAAEDRWPRFAAAAAEQGVRSMLSVQLFVEGETLGALNLYAGEPRRFDDHDESVAMLLAAHAAVAIRGQQIAAGLRTALVARDLIGQAKGILMERYKITDSQAFSMLVVVSQRANRKLRDVAQELATTGELQSAPPPDHPRPGPPRPR